MRIHKPFIGAPSEAAPPMPRRFRSSDPYSGISAFRTAVHQHEAMTKAQTPPVDAADVFKNSLQHAEASALRDLENAARIYVKRTTGKNYKVTLEPEPE